MSVRTGNFLSGNKIVPERIREDRGPYIEALRGADRAWAQGNLDLSLMVTYLARLLEAQLNEGADDSVSEQLPTNG